MPAILAQQPQPTPVSAERFRALTGWTGLAIAILLIVLVCAVALISRHRIRLAAASRAHARPRAKSHVDPWAESARRMATPPAPDAASGASEDQR